MHMTIAAAVLGGTLSLLHCAGPAQAGECTGEIANLTKQVTATDAGSGPTAGSPPASPGSADASQHPPTGRMTDATQGRAASPQDVRQQTQGAPTAADQAKSGTGSESRGVEISALLERAKSLDQTGKEADCMDAVRQAKLLLSK